MAGLVGEAIRGRFPVFRDKVYVNSCSQGALSDAVRAAYEEYLDGWDENGAEWGHWVERSEAARAAFAGLLGAAPDDVAIQTSVSAAVSGLISALRFRDGRNRIVISENEFPTIGQIAHAQELRGAEVVHVEPDPESYAAAIDERTALVASTLVSYRTGAVHDVESIYAIARGHGALMLVDGYQGIGAIPIEAARVGDVVVGGTVKYLLASAGLAFMALRPGLVEELVPVQTGWFADENVFDMQIERYRPHRSARRFDAGTPPVPNIYAGVAGVGLIAEAGVPAIQEHVRGLVERLLGGSRRARGDGRGAAARPARLRPLDGRPGARGRCSRRRTSSPRSATRASASRCTSTTPTTTSTPSSRHWRGTAHSWLDSNSKIAIIANMRYEEKRPLPLERLRARLAGAEEGWFFASIATEVAERRAARGLSQRELADLVGTTQSAIARLESGGRPPRIDTLLRIADALECDLHVELTPRADSTEGTT